VPHDDALLLQEEMAACLPSIYSIIIRTVFSTTSTAPPHMSLKRTDSAAHAGSDGLVLKLTSALSFARGLGLLLRLLPAAIPLSAAVGPAVATASPSRPIHACRTR
jgi:hypothetical protein